MRGDKDYVTSYQFGPVNTYFLVGSLYIRLGKYGSCPRNVVCGKDGEWYEWDDYSISDFKKEWSPSDFQ